jgi:hypothetical protein
VLKGVKKSRSKMKHGNIEEEVYDLIMRRPCTFRQISTSLGINEEELEPIVDRMLSSKNIKEKAVGEKKYYKVN